MEYLQKFNLEFVKQKKKIDEINNEFYSKFSYPWPPVYFPSFHKGEFVKMVNQDIGYYDHDRLLENCRIWVAGCGTNQAIFTALKYPKAEVLGTDVSTESLKICKRNSENIGIKNLNFLQKSINEVDFEDEFDFIISTGVIHHNSDPGFTLSKLSSALKKDGIMELMVYNYYHRVLNVATQKAIRSLAKDSQDFEDQFGIAKKLIKNFPLQNIVGDFLGHHKKASDAELADALFQPVEYSYTIETLQELLDNSNLMYLQPCNNQFSKEKNINNWNLRFSDNGLAQTYEALPDIKRWQISNLLMLNDSPMLWFYIQRRDSNKLRKSETEICNEFLNRKFGHFSTTIRNYVQDKNGNYSLKDATMNYPMPSEPLDEISRRVFESIDPGLSMKENLQSLGIPLSFQHVNDIRINLTTTSYPYLQSIIDAV